MFICYSNFIYDLTLRWQQNINGYSYYYKRTSCKKQRQMKLIY